MLGTRLSEAIIALRGIRSARHPYVDTEWYRDTLGWSASDGDLLTTVCAAPNGPPAFLLDCLWSANPWPDELYDLLGLDEETVTRGIGDAFGDEIPDVVQAGFADHRSGLASVIRQFDVYVSSVLEPLWLRVSMALSSEVDQLKEQLGQRLDNSTSADVPVLVPTVFGTETQTLRWGRSVLVTAPVSDATAVMSQARLPRAPVSTLIGAHRAAILYALGDAMTARDLARVTGQRKGNLLHHLRVLRRTNLVSEIKVSREPSMYRRTTVGDLLIDPSGEQ